MSDKDKLKSLKEENEFLESLKAALEDVKAGRISEHKFEDF